jgi:hypothetical protein
MLMVPTKPLPNQQLQVQLGAQSCSLSIYQSDYGLFMDVRVAGALIIAGVLCENLNRIVRSTYLGFVGDLMWFDAQGKSDPVYTELGTRFVLIYLEEADLPSED